jgi:hypothetical protein
MALRTAATPIRQVSTPFSRLAMRDFGLLRQDAAGKIAKLNRFIGGP